MRLLVRQNPENAIHSIATVAHQRGPSTSRTRFYFGLQPFSTDSMVVVDGGATIVALTDDSSVVGGKLAEEVLTLG